MKFLIILSILFSVQLSFGQETRTREFETWTSFDFAWKINKKWKVKVRNQERFIFESQPVKQAFLQGTVDRKLYKHHNIFVRYRYTFDNFNEHNIVRYSIGYKFKYKFTKTISISNRTIFQYEQRVYTLEPSSALRNKLEFNYNLKKKKNLYFAYEVFIAQKKKWQFDTHRMTLGLSKKLKKNFEINTFYRIDFSVNRNKNTNQHIVGLGLSYNL